MAELPAPPPDEGQQDEDEWNLDVLADQQIPLSQQIIAGVPINSLERFCDTNNVTVERVREAECHLLLTTAGYGRLDCVEWLITHFDLNSDDIRNSGAFHLSIIKGHVDVAQRLVEMGELTKDDIDQHTIDMCVIKREVRGIAWLVATFRLGDEFDLIELDDEFRGHVITAIKGFTPPLVKAAVK